MKLTISQLREKCERETYNSDQDLPPQAEGRWHWIPTDEMALSSSLQQGKKPARKNYKG